MCKIMCTLVPYMYMQCINRHKYIYKLFKSNYILIYVYQDELDELIHKLENRIEAKSKKTNQIKQNKQER